MLTSVILRNFKAFRVGDLPTLRPLTVLAGPNNAGKSSVLQAIHFLSRSIFQGGFRYGNIGFQLSSFHETVHNHDPDSNITLELGFSVPDETRTAMKGAWRSKWTFRRSHLESADGFTYQVTFGRNRVAEERLELQGTPLIVNSPSDGRFSYPSHQPPGDYSYGSTQGLLAFPLSGQPGTLVAPMVEHIRETCRRMHYFSPSRRSDVFSASVAQEQPDVGHSGEHTVARLHYLYSNKPETFQRIKEWVARFDRDIEEMLSPLRQGQTSVVLESRDVRHNVATTGFGLAQALPIIVQCCDSPPGSIFLIEEPEIHLHPEAVAVLLDLFLQMMEEHKQFILTTHSISLLTDLRWRLAKGKVSRKSLSGFDVSKEKGESHAEPVDLTEKQWPAFDKTVEKLRGLS